MNQPNKSKVLKERAEKLATQIEQKTSVSDYKQILVFYIAKEQYGVETKIIREVYPLKEYTQLPTAPSYILGLINIRRRIIPIIDLKVLFSIPDEESKDNKIIVLASGDNEFGLLCNGIRDILKIPETDIQPPLPTLTGIRQDLLLGISIEGIAILDEKKLFSSTHLKVNETVDL